MELGLWECLVYHCNRCNYAWLPKDFEFTGGDRLMKAEPPKSCARCKSKYWRNVPKRNMKYTHKFASITRFNALIRKGGYLAAVDLRPDLANPIINGLKLAGVGPQTI